ncbi:MAG TPA: hypothetical protein VF520_06880 [Thermoleophilaceae bacterium]|jgi:hypothetical protein
MASRKEEKERLRAEREERERQEQEQAQRRARRIRVLSAAAVLLVAVIVIVVVASGGGGKSSKAEANQGLQVSPGPWSAETAGLKKRSEALKLPDPSDTIYHVHAQLQVFVNGKQSKVPMNIGIDQDSQFLASLHTHDDKGIIHMEAVEPYPFTLGQFFTIWGVKFTKTELGAYRAGNGLTLDTFVNGKKVPDGPGYQMKSHDVIVVAFGKPGEAPKTFKPEFGPGE